MGYRARPVRQVGRRGRHVAGGGPVPVERDEAVHLLPDGQATRVLAQPANNAGHLVRGDDRRAVPAVPGGPRQVPGQLGERDAGRMHLHQGLARPRYRDRGLLEYQLFRPPRACARSAIIVAGTVTAIPLLRPDPGRDPPPYSPSLTVV